MGVVYVDAAGFLVSPLLRARSISIVPAGREIIGGGGTFFATAQYSTSTGGGGTKDRNGLELVPDGPAHFSSEDSLADEPTDIDRFGEPIDNSARVPYDPPFSFPRPSQFIVAEFIRSGQNWFSAENFAAAFRGRKNSTTWKGVAAGNALVHSFKPKALESAAFTDTGLVKFTLRIERRPNTVLGILSFPGFNKGALDKGRMELDANAPTGLRPIMVQDEQGRQVQVSEDVPLDGNGKRLDPNLGQRVILVFDGIPEIDINLIGI